VQCKEVDSRTVKRVSKAQAVAQADELLAWMGLADEKRTRRLLARLVG
jgi:hypothetical protein